MAREQRLGTFSLILATGLFLGVSACKTQESPAGELVQGWNASQRSSWYEGTQGSRLLPLSWARALEQAGSQELFFTDASLTRFRFLPLPNSRSGLPVGFAVDDSDAGGLSYTNLTWYQGQPAREQWVGLNCSACHTARFSYQGQETTVDGGPSLVDFQAFIEGVDAAMAATRADAAKWERFAARVLANRDNGPNRDALRREFDRLLAFYRENARLNATPLRYGYGRLDAFGHIFNKVAQLAAYEANPAVTATANPADAPVSYPFLWDIYRQDRLQWNGIVASKRIPLGGSRYLDVGALGRNTGEVIGVFGDIVLRPNSIPRGFPSSVQTTNLDRLETVLRSLQAPRWPANFPALDQARVQAGQALFESAGCRGCHQPQPAGTAVYPVRMVALERNSQGTPNPNNTDPWMACNALTYTSPAGKLTGTRSRYLGGDPMTGDAPLSSMLSASVIGSIVNHWQQVVGSTLRIFFGIERLPRVVVPTTEVPGAERLARLDACFQINDLPREPNAPPPFAYKARPLDGIWATAPYLHNGSVPTLYDLLLPPAQRPRSFNVGTREYDPAKVGYRTDAAAADNGFAFTASGAGNSNEGHDYGVGRLTEEQRLALLEYLKSL